MTSERNTLLITSITTVGILDNVTSFVDAPWGDVLNQWAFLAWVERSTTDRSFWMNTTEGVNSDTLGLGSGIDSISFGVHGDSSPSNPFSGNLAEWGVWDRALDDAEILQLAAGYTPDHIPRGLVGYWPLNDGAGNERDFGSGGRTLTETGTVTKVDHPKMITLDDDQLIIPASVAPPTTIVGRNLLYSEKLSRISLVG